MEEVNNEDLALCVTALSAGISVQLKLLSFEKHLTKRRINDIII